MLELIPPHLNQLLFSPKVLRDCHWIERDVEDLQYLLLDALESHQAGAWDVDSDAPVKTVRIHYVGSDLHGEGTISVYQDAKPRPAATLEWWIR